MSNLFPTFDQFITRARKEALLQQTGKVYWLFGQSGTGKTTIAIELEKELHAQGKFVIVLDGDNLRSGLNSGLGFSTEDRIENIRRAAELAKILIQNGVIVICCFVCPLQSMRNLAREIIGSEFVEIWIHTSLETLMKRDTKGFYKKAIEGNMSNLTGINAEFEPSPHADIIIDTDDTSVNDSVQNILTRQ